MNSNSNEIRLKLPRDLLQAVTDLVGAKVSTINGGNCEDHPLYKAERILDGALLFNEERQSG